MVVMTREGRKKYKEKYKGREDEAPQIVGGTTDGVKFDVAKEKGQKKGLEMAQRYYGQSPSQTSEDVQKIIKARRENLGQAGPQSTAVRQSANRQIMRDRAIRGAEGGGNEAMEAQLRRGGEVQAAQSDYNNRLRNLQLFQRTIGNVLSGQSGMEMGQQQLELSGTVPSPPQPGGGIGGTVICTELFRQGYMDKETYKKDQEYGYNLIQEKPHIYAGYYFLATPVVKLMKKSPIFTKLISYPALAWAKNMSGQKNLVGRAISGIGELVCGAVGKTLNFIRRGGLYANG